VDGQNRIEEMRQPNPMRLGHQSEEVPVAIEAPGTPNLDDLKPR
jgi:hypothetical protein